MDVLSRGLFLRIYFKSTRDSASNSLFTVALNIPGLRPLKTRRVGERGGVLLFDKNCANSPIFWLFIIEFCNLLGKLVELDLCTFTPELLMKFRRDSGLFISNICSYFYYTSDSLDMSISLTISKPNMNGCILNGTPLYIAVCWRTSMSRWLKGPA